MDNEFDVDLITLIDDDGAEYNYRILDVLDYNDSQYYALYPAFDDPDEAINDTGEYYIMEVVEEDGEQQLAEIEDDSLLDELASLFEARFEDIFDDDEDDDCCDEECGCCHDIEEEENSEDDN